MPIFDYRCEECGYVKEVIDTGEKKTPLCCGQLMKRMLHFPVMVKIKGEGGYPSRRKFIKGSAPHTTRSTKPWLSYDPGDTNANPMGQKVEASS